MGKGDKKSKKGKLWKGSYGVLRSRKSIKARLKRATSRPAAQQTAAAEKPKAKRSPRKKEAAAE